MRILLYKRTHKGDPDRNGCFGAYDCMGAIRDRDFDAVIGIGGIGSEAKASGIASKINWIGIGPHKTFVPDKRGPEVTFDRFLDFGIDGPDFNVMAPTLAERMYSQNVRHMTDDFNEQEYGEAIGILQMAEDAPPSPGYKTMHGRTCRSQHCRSHVAKQSQQGLQEQRLG